MRDNQAMGEVRAEQELGAQAEPGVALSAGEREWVEEFLREAPAVGELEAVWLCRRLYRLAA